MGVVIEICAKHPGGPTRITVADIHRNPHCALWYFIISEITSLCPMAHEHGSTADDVVRDDGVAAIDGVGAGEGDDELQDGGHSKRRRLAGGDDSERPLLPPPLLQELKP